MTSITINNTEPRAQYTAAAAQTVFTYGWEIFADSDLVVIVDGVTQTLNTDYTVTGAETVDGGTVVFASAMAGGEVVTIYSDIPVDRDTIKYQNNGDFLAATVERDFARTTAIQKQLERDVSRAIRLPADDPLAGSAMLLADQVSRKGKYIRFRDSDGAPELADVTASTTILSQSVVGDFLYPQIQAETDVSVVPTNKHRLWFHGGRYGPKRISDRG